MTVMSRPPDLLTVEEAAAWLRIGRTCAYQLCRRYLATNGAEGIPCIRVGRLLRVPRAMLEQRFGIVVTDVPQVDDLTAVDDTDEPANAVVVPIVCPTPSPTRRPHRTRTAQPSLPFRK